MKQKQQTEAAYTGFIQSLVIHKVGNVAELIQQILLKKQSMTPQEKLAQIDQLKLWLDSFRPLASDVVAELKKHYDVKFTYNSNAIEGNTLTQSETEMVLEKGIMVGGKTLAEHLEAAGYGSHVIRTMEFGGFAFLTAEGVRTLNSAERRRLKRGNLQLRNQQAVAEVGSGEDGNLERDGAAGGTQDGDEVPARPSI